MDKSDQGTQKVKDSDVIQTLRTAHQSQTHLIQLADQKANILIGVTAVIFSILFTKSESLMNIHNWVVYPIIGFLFTEIIAIILAFFVILPKNIKRCRNRSIDEVSNPLFFGSFTKFSQDQFLDYLSNRLVDNDSAREMLAKDYYQRGIVLKRKYALLKYSYIFAIISFLLLVGSTITIILVR